MVLGGFGKIDVQKTAIAFKVPLGAAQTRHAPRQVIGHGQKSADCADRGIGLL